MSRFRLLLALFCAAALLPGAALAQQERGTVTGAVIDAGTQQPLAGVQILIVGTQIGTLTNQQGRYLIPNVPAGSREVRAALIGYGQGSQTVTVAAGETATANFSLTQTAVAIEGMIVMATGRAERRREVGNAVSTISTDAVELSAVPNMAALIQGRAAGVAVLPSGGTSGSGARVRIRGSNSVSLSNEPLLVIDGIRVNNSPQSLTVGTGGQSPSRINDINPEDIESIEILKGPAAAALYGTAAANGVIQITTRRGRAGATSWSVWSELGSVVERTQYRDNAIDEDWCAVFYQAEGLCEAGTLHRDNPFHEADLRPFIDGNRRKVGLSVSGGTDVTTYYISTEMDREQGIFEPNTVGRLNLRANLNTRLHEQVNVGIRTGYMNGLITMPQNDNNFAGIHLNGNLGYPRSHPDGSTGWYWQTPEQVFAFDTEQEISRLIASGTVDYQPLPWLSLVGVAGLDRFSRHDNQFIAPEISTVSVNALAGYRTSNRADVWNLTGTVDARATFSLMENLTSATSTGVQYTRDEFHDTRGFGVGIVPGSQSLSGTVRQFSVSENTSENATFGAYISQQFGLNDRLFLTGTIRGDQNSAFGTDIGWVNYPSLSASWVASEEPFFPANPVLSTLRLRTSYGRSGLRPAFRDALTFFAPVAVRAGATETPAVTVGGTGNPELRPEIVTEYEVGFEAGFISDRLSLDFTYYNKQSQDAMILRRLAPSVGATVARFENIGSVSNVGWESLVTARILEGPQVAWDVTASYARTRNELIELGEGVEPIIFGLGANTQRHQEGFPLGGYWGRLLSWTDENGDGLIQAAEVVEGDTAVFLGTPFPTREASFNTGVTLFNLVRLSALVDYRGGHHLYNFTRGDRCAWEMVCEETYNAAAASASDQLGWIGFNIFNRNVTEYIEPADFVKLRELSVSVSVPQQYLRTAGLSGARVTFSGRNPGIFGWENGIIWTRYSGYDPEVNTFGQENFATADYHNQPPAQHYTVRFDVNF